MNDTGVKQQIVGSIKSSDSILVTVGQNPSVDELSSALGLTMYLNDIGKHATAVVSGDIPPAITFLKPEKTFENSVDSLRDFVIALDKEKADHLRYKVDGDVVKIFITPYKTIITKKDLKYSQGDYNVEMVLALGVKSQDQLDKALSAHGRILHDASVATIGLEPSTLGTMDWSDAEASSLSEMVFNLIEGLKDGEKPATERVASALLTGIVASTDRFSNNKTTSNSLTVSAKLMALGANQQLIASKLREGGKLDLNEGQSSQKIGGEPIGTPKQPEPVDEPKEKDTININHESISQDSDDADNDIEKNNEQSTNEEANSAVTDSPEVANQQPSIENDVLPPVDSNEVSKNIEDVPATVPDNPTDGIVPPQPNINQENVPVQNELPALDSPIQETVAPEPVYQETVDPVETPASQPLDQPVIPSAEDALSKLDELVAPSPVVAPTPGPVFEPMSNNPSEASILATELATEAKNMSNVGASYPEIGPVRQSGPQISEPSAPAIDNQQVKPILSHGSGYIGDNQPMFQSPINGADMTDEPPTVDPFADSSSPIARAKTIEAPLQPPVIQPLSQVEPMAMPNTPPPPPTPDFSQLPPMPPDVPDFNQLPPSMPANGPLMPEQPLGQILPPVPEQVANPAVADPGQFRIPGQ